MDVETYFKDMYYNIWQSHDIGRFDEFYAKDFHETIMTSDDSKQPVQLQMNYDELKAQTIWQKDNYKDTTIEYKKIIAGEGSHISVCFYSTSTYIPTGDLHHRCVSGIWHINNNHQIDHVCAVVTPFYPK
tara:strand:- start:142488 stop:142877 length:390 start_codon:yes stop_codon:yes gene_type:complete